MDLLEYVKKTYQLTSQNVIRLEMGLMNLETEFNQMTLPQVNSQEFAQNFYQKAINLLIKVGIHEDEIDHFVYYLYRSDYYQDLATYIVMCYSRLGLVDEKFERTIKRMQKDLVNDE